MKLSIFFSKKYNSNSKNIFSKKNQKTSGKILKMFSFLGRLLFTSLFLLSGYRKILDPLPFSSFLVSRYTHLEALSSQHSIALPMSAEVLGQQSEHMIKIIGIGLIVLSVGILAKVPLTSFGITIFLISTIVVIHNPFFFESKTEFWGEIHHVILNLALVGVSLLFLVENRDEEDVKVKKSKKKKKKSVEEKEKTVKEEVKKSEELEKEKGKNKTEKKSEKNKKKK